MSSVGQVVFSLFEDYLKVQKGLRPGSIRSYRDTLKLFLIHVAGLCRRPITRLVLSDLAFERVLDFLRMIEKREASPVREISDLPPCARSTDTSMFLYNTGARAQEAADLQIADLDLSEPYRVRLHGKGDKWRSCPIWSETAELLRQLMTTRPMEKTTSVLISQQCKPLTRFGIYKIVKRHTLKCSALGETHSGVFPHALRHYLPFLTMSSDMEGCWRSFNNHGP
jgi:integrase